ncbi:acyl carrier protein [Streptomyces sp. NRRL B-24484]|uniref:acyl carrier protein n=1 Tax=Streptomyces sp. NRRL B-24484 TaxID=1463833 RepID=UPI000B0F7515|nr:acyl carrier protein [Streptomyces sp. NRRL B-24484]
MATGETVFSDVAFDLISVQYHALKAGYEAGRYVRDAEHAGDREAAAFFRTVMAEDSARAEQCHRLLKRLTATAGAVQPGGQDVGGGGDGARAGEEQDGDGATWFQEAGRA